MPGPEEGPPSSPAAVVARMLREASPYIAAAWTVGAALVIGVLGGRWLDQRWGTRPWLTMLGLVLGIVVGFYELARVMWRSEARRKK